MDHPAAAAAAAAPHPAIATHTQLAYGALPQTPPPPALQQAGMATPYPPPPPQPIAQASPVVGAYSPALYQASAASQALSYQHLQQQHQQQLQDFWAGQMQEIEQVNDFKNHQLPLARIKKIMKADEDVRMISAEAPVLFAKACEMFILELTLRSWIHTEENKRRTLQKNDIAAAITRTDIFDFLVDIVPRDELKEEGLGMPRAADAIPYGGLYYVPQSQGPHRPDPNIYPQQQRMATMPYMPPQSVQQVWQQQQQQQPHIANTPPGAPPSSS